MADPLKQMRDALGVCTEEALFYLEGFRWDLNAAMEACRTKTLPSLTAQPPSPAQLTSSENEITAEEKQMRKEKIDNFLEVATGSSVADAVKYLSDNNWNLDYAGRSFFAHRYDQPEEKPKPVPLSHDGDVEKWYLQGFSGDEGSSGLVEEVLSQVPQFRNTSTSLRIGNPPSASTPPFELKQESINEFRNLLPEAPSQAVIDCLNQCKGNVENAIRYFHDKYSKPRSGIATAQVVKNFSGMDVDQDPSTDQALPHIPEAKPLVAPSQVEVQASQERDETWSSSSTPRLELTPESIKQFRDFVSVASSQAAIDCLNKCKGNVSDAIDHYYGNYKKEDPSGIATAQVVKDFTGMDVDQDSSTESHQRIPDAKPLVASSQVEESGNPTGNLPLKGEESADVKEEHIGSFVKMTGMTTREDAIAYLEHFKWDVNEAVKFFEEHGYSGEVISALSMSLMENADAPSGPTETQRSLEKGGEGDVTVAIPGMDKSHVKESTSPTQTREGSGTSLNQLLNSMKDKLIDVLVEAANGEVTRDDATVYLTRYNWDVNQAFSRLLEGTLQVKPSQEGETGSASSSSEADSTDTGNATVASSQVDENVEEDSGTELSAVPISTTATTIELEISLDDGGSRVPVWIRVRTDQTVRDIRNRIAAFRPDDKRDYYLRSDTGVEYRDLDTTVHNITSGSRGSTVLHQMCST